MLFCALLSGCGGSTDPNAALERFQTALEALRSLSVGHARQIQGASLDASTLATLEAQHWVDMGPPMEAFGAAVARLGKCERLCCMDDGSAMRGMSQEMELHRGRMTLADAVAEEARHQQEMGSDLDKLAVQHSGMMRMMEMHLDLGCPPGR